MAAYAALVSVLHIIEQIQHHPNPPISLDQNQVESLTKNVTSLQEFLEGYSHLASADALESRIAYAAYAAEDLIESHIVYQIESRFHEGSSKISSVVDFYRSLWEVIRFDRRFHKGSRKNSSAVDFHKSLQEVIVKMDSINKEVMGITKENMEVQDQLHKYLSTSASSSTSPSIRHNTTMVGFDDALNEVLDKLTGLQYNLHIFPIFGMGGTGKTTLARNIYANAFIVEHFDILAWVTISQVYSAHRILLQLLSQTEKSSEKVLCEKSEGELGVMLYKFLSFRRYLIVMDDMWSIDIWDKIKFYFPQNNNGSRIMVTTRLSNLAFQLSGSYGFQMNFLNEIQSWDLFLQIVVDCPTELEDIGKKIVRKCKGLPLSIVVIGGLLTKYKGVREYWEYILKNISSTINLENDEGCLQILRTSYKELPVHLKPCFLYMGIFPEDEEIRVSELVKLWVAEGFLKPMDGKSLEAVAEECFKELIDRNLILVHDLSYIGRVKFCKIHDLLRDLCLREAQKHKFLCVMRPCDLNSSQCIETERRIVIYKSMSKDDYDPSQVLNALRSATVARTLIVDYMKRDVEEVFGRVHPRLLRIFKTEDSISLDAFHTLRNLRYIFYRNGGCNVEKLSSDSQWNLQTVIMRNAMLSLPGFRKFPLLRHLDFSCVFYPRNHSNDEFVQRNLQTFHGMIYDYREKVIDRIPNIKKLRIFYCEYDKALIDSLQNLGLLHKLEHLNLRLPDPSIRSALLQKLSFPCSLKKLTLLNSQLYWEDMTTKIGSLPFLEVLMLRADSFVGPEWVTVEGQFCSLKFLLIDRCTSLEYWTSESNHFPRLEHLHLFYLNKLHEIPQGLGEIPTLQSIKLTYCSDSAVISAKRIQEEQEGFGNYDLQVKVVTFPSNTSSRREGFIGSTTERILEEQVEFGNEGQHV